MTFGSFHEISGGIEEIKGFEPLNNKTQPNKQNFPGTVCVFVNGRCLLKPGLSRVIMDLNCANHFQLTIRQRKS